MKNAKRLFAAVMCITLALSWFIIPAAAEDDADDGHVHVHSVDESSPAVEGAPNITVSVKPVGAYNPDFYNIKSGDNATKFCLSDDVQVTVSDSDGLASVEVNGKALNIGDDVKTYVFTPEAGELTITAKDKSGNVSTLEITVYSAHDERTSYLENDAPDCVMSWYNRQLVYYCVNCGNARLPYGLRPLQSSKGHDFHDVEVTDACGHEGIKQVCSKCGFSRMAEGSDIGDDSEHTWQLVLKPAEHCGESGSKYYQCTKCGAVKDAVALSPLGHLYPRYGEVKVPANCADETDGIEIYTCLLCDESYEATLKWYHSWSNWEVTTAPDCRTETDGVKTKHCTNEGCTATETVTYPYSHAWRYSYVIDDPGNCVEPGSKSIHCSVCDTIKPGSSVPIPPREEHEYIDHDGLCTTPRECKYCGAKDPSDTDVRTEHSLVLQSNESGHWYKCEYCKYTTEHEEHSWGEWTASSLYHRRYCTACNQQETVSHTDEHKLDDGDCTTDIKCPDCGYVFKKGATSHTYDSAAWLADDENHWHACTSSGCDSKTAVAAHTTAPDADCTKGISCAVCAHPLLSPTAQHEWSEWELTPDKTKLTRHCTTDGCTVVETADHQHEFGNWTSVDADTHSRTCEICGFVESGTHNASHDNSCLTETVCETCGHVITPAQTSHNMKWTVNPDGTHTGVCTNENCTYTVEGEHVFTPWTSTDTEHSRVCTVCGHTERGEHNAVDDGDCTTEDRCSVCDKVVTAAMSAHHYGAWTEKADDYAMHVRVCTNPGCKSTESEAHRGTDDGDCTTAVKCDVCGMEYIRARAHNPAGEFITSADGHSQRCSNDGCTKTVLYPHILLNDGDRDCSTPTYCVTCGYVAVEAQQHNWSSWIYLDSTSHYRKCDNENCDVVGEVAAHDGEATCNAKAHCSACGADYGEIDPDNHSGGTEVRGYIPPTHTEDGYTGDTYCLGCGKKIADGEVIHPLSDNHDFGEDWIFDSTHHWRECVTCRTRTEYASHQFGEMRSDATGHYRVCSTCGFIDRADHTPIKDDNDCTTPVTCSVCGYVITPAGTHDFSGSAYATEDGHHFVCQNTGCTVTSETTAHTGGKATCFTLAVCEVCGTAYGELDCENHAGGEVVLGYLDPTDVNPGYTGDGYCIGCGEIVFKGRSIPVGEREHPVIIVEYDENYCWDACASCGVRLSGSYKPHSYLHVGDVSAVSDDDECIYCGNVNPYFGHEHSFGAFVTRREATCSEVGVRATECSECGATFIAEIPVTDHNWDNGTVTTPPTCVDEGERIYTCLDCGAVKSEVIPATGEHSWDDGVVSVPVKGETDGEIIYTCTVCGETRTEVIPANGEHYWDDGVVLTEPDCIHAGSVIYTCTGCGTTKTELIPATGKHVYKDGKCTVCGAAEPSDLPQSPQTMDDIPWTLIAAVAVFSGCGVTLILIRRKRAK